MKISAEQNKDQVLKQGATLLIADNLEQVYGFLRPIIKKQRSQIIYVTYGGVLNKLVREISPSFIIDCTGSCSIQGSSGKHLLSGPGSLTELSLQLLSRCEKIDQPMVIFNSINLFLAHNDISLFKRFFMYLLTRNQQKSRSYLLIYLEDEHQTEVVPFLNSLVDNLVRL